MCREVWVGSDVLAGLLSPSLAAWEVEKGRTGAERPIRTASV